MNYNECFEELKKRSKDGYYWLEFCKRHYAASDEDTIAIRAYINGEWRRECRTYAEVITEIDNMIPEPEPPSDGSEHAEIDKTIP